MSKRRGIRLVDLSLGPIPAEVINLTLGLDLDPGPVILSRNAQKHALSSHPVEYPPCLPHVAAVVADPLNLGDDFKNGGKIEMIGRVPALGSFLLVAVTIERDPAGRYNVCSFYPISEKKIQPRRARGYLASRFQGVETTEAPVSRSPCEVVQITKRCRDAQIRISSHRPHGMPCSRCYFAPALSVGA